MARMMREGENTTRARSMRSKRREKMRKGFKMASRSHVPVTPEFITL